MRLIDADAVKLPEGFFEKVDNVPKFYDWLNSLPTIDAVEVVHAHWEQDSHGTLYCSRCGRPTYDSHDVPIEFNGMKGLALVWPYYCGFCGARMDGGDKNAIS